MRRGPARLLRLSSRETQSGAGGGPAFVLPRDNPLLGEDARPRPADMGLASTGRLGRRDGRRRKDKGRPTGRPFPFLIRSRGRADRGDEHLLEPREVAVHGELGARGSARSSPSAKVSSLTPSRVPSTSRRSLSARSHDSASVGGQLVRAAVASITSKASRRPSISSSAISRRYSALAAAVVVRGREEPPQDGSSGADFKQRAQLARQLAQQLALGRRQANRTPPSGAGRSRCWSPSVLPASSPTGRARAGGRRRARPSRASRSRRPPCPCCAPGASAGSPSRASSRTASGTRARRSS